MPDHSVKRSNTQVDSLIEDGLSTGNAPEAAQGFAMVKTTEDAQQFAKATAAQLSTGAVPCLYMCSRRRILGILVK